MNIKVLRNKNFSLLILGKLVSAIGTDMMSFALSLYVLKITGSAKYFAAILSIAYIPRIILGPIFGVFADWFDRKKIIVILDMMAGVFVLSLYLINITVGIELIHIYITVIVLTCISCLFNPSASTVIPSIMKKEELVDANAFNSLVITISSISGPLLAGIIYGSFGLSITILINGISFILSSISEMFIDIPKLQNQKERKISFGGFVKDFTEGISFTRKSTTLFKLLICSLVVNFVFAPMIFIGVPFILKVLWKVSDIQYGIYQSIVIVGTLMGSFVIKFVSNRMKIINIYIYGLATVGILTGLISLICTPIIYNSINISIIPFALLSTFGLLIFMVATIINISLYTILQSETPLDKFGRVIAMWETLGVALVPIGQIIYGYLYDAYPIYIPILVSASVLVLVSVIFKIAFSKGEESTELKDEDNISQAIADNS